MQGKLRLYYECYKPIIVPQYPVGNKKCSYEIDEVLKTDGQKKDKNTPKSRLTGCCIVKDP